MKAWPVILGIGGIVLLSQLRTTAAGTGKARPASVLILGDSHSEASYTLGGRLASEIEAAGIPVTLEGHRNRGVEWYLTSGTLASSLADLPPDLAIVQLGGRDAVEVYEEMDYKELLLAFVEQLRQAGTNTIVWLSPTKHEGSAWSQTQRREIARWQAEYLPSLGVEVFDQYPVTIDLATVDGVHYGPIQYQVWAERLLADPLAWVIA